MLRTYNVFAHVFITCHGSQITVSDGKNVLLIKYFIINTSLITIILNLFIHFIVKKKHG